MKRFDFRLQRTLDVRTLQSEKERSELERLHSERNRISERRNTVRQELIETTGEQSSAAVRRAEQIQQQALFTLSLRNLDQHLAEQQAVCDRAITQQVQRCVTADRNRELLQKMRDAERQDWQKQADNEMEQTAAEVWNAVYGRRPAIQRD